MAPQASNHLPDPDSNTYAMCYYKDGQQVPASENLRMFRETQAWREEHGYSIEKLESLSDSELAWLKEDWVQGEDEEKLFRETQRCFS